MSFSWKNFRMAVTKLATRTCVLLATWVGKKATSTYRFMKPCNPKLKRNRGKLLNTNTNFSKQGTAGNVCSVKYRRTSEYCRGRWVYVVRYVYIVYLGRIPQEINRWGNIMGAAKTLFSKFKRALKVWYIQRPYRDCRFSPQLFPFCTGHFFVGIFTLTKKKEVWKCGKSRANRSSSTWNSWWMEHEC